MNDHIIRINEARLKYKPEQITCLFIAEAPPSNEDRFFYFEDVREQDSLYLEMMKAIFNDDQAKDGQQEIESIFSFGGIATHDLRGNKIDWLTKFKEKGYYLIDSLDHPIPYGLNTKDKIKLLESNKHILSDKTKGLVDTKTPIVLISIPVYQAMAGTLKYNGYNVINKGGIPFPGSGQQQRFQEAMSLILQTLPRD